MLALFTDLAFSELLVIAAIAVMVFGRDLPRVAAKAVVQFQRVRRTMQQVWRESGINEEVRRVQREMEDAARTVREVTPEDPLESAVRGVREDLERSAREAGAPVDGAAEATPGPEETAEEEGPDLAEEPGPAEPAGEAERRAAWYPRPEDDPFGRDPA